MIVDPGRWIGQVCSFGWKVVVVMMMTTMLVEVVDVDVDVEQKRRGSWED